jgi:hypothetical protein
MNWKQWLIIIFIIFLMFFPMIVGANFKTAIITFMSAMFWMWLGKIFWTKNKGA